MQSYIKSLIVLFDSNM